MTIRNANSISQQKHCQQNFKEVITGKKTGFNGATFKNLYIGGNKNEN